MIQAALVFALELLFAGVNIEVLWAVTEQSLWLVGGCEVSLALVGLVGLEISMQYGVGWVVLQEVGLD